MKHIHGGDIYAETWNEEPLDFSANINPFGMPDSVREAAQQAIAGCLHYPDPFCRALRQTVAQRDDVTAEQIFCGNGAADVLYRLMLTLRPKKILLPAPTFAEYEEAAQLVGSEIVRFPLGKDLTVTEAYWDAVTPDIDLVVLCNPNNPTGLLTPKWLVKKGMERCAEVGARLLVDECFHDFLCEPEDSSMTDQLRDNHHLILLRSFTKMYAMPGIRLGYCLSADQELIEQLYEAGAPWSVSVIAQACGMAAAQDVDFPQKTREYVARQRETLKRGLEDLGMYVVDGQVNYLLFRSTEIPALQRRLHDRGILIRSCANYHGLDDTWFRVAVRSEAENFVLLHTLRQLKEESAWQR